eukprot:scaffold2921_cov61-Phaeocystis_antarctica.AAC.2
MRVTARGCTRPAQPDVVERRMHSSAPASATACISSLAREALIKHSSLELEGRHAWHIACHRRARARALRAEPGVASRDDWAGGVLEPADCPQRLECLALVLVRHEVLEPLRRLEVCARCGRRRQLGLVEGGGGVGRRSGLSLPPLPRLKELARAVGAARGPHQQLALVPGVGAGRAQEDDSHARVVVSYTWLWTTATTSGFTSAQKRSLRQ